MPIVEKIYPEYIRLDGGTQPRVQVSQEVCDEYAEQMRAGQPFPHIDVYFDGEDYWLADGFHRHQASMFARPGEAMECRIYQGTQQDAQWHSYSVNKTHGLRRTNQDKIRAVKSALQHPEGAGKSDRQIGEHVGVHFNTVSRHRKALEREVTITRSDSRTGRDGRAINTSNIGKTKRKGKKSGSRKSSTRISRNANLPKLGHSKPRPMIAMQLPPNNPQMAGATLWQLFDLPFIESLIQDLTQRIQEQGEN